MAEEKKKKICVDCKKEEVFQKKERFDRCFSCAMSYRDKMHKEFISVLSVEQLALFKTYNDAREDFTSMIILD